jgi:hypothetical protein
MWSDDNLSSDTAVTLSQATKTSTTAAGSKMCTEKAAREGLQQLLHCTSNDRDQPTAND